MLSGHTHQDDFRLLYTDGEATVVDILSPSISTSNSNNPSVREVVFSPQLGYELLDWRQYIFDLYQANILVSTLPVLVNLTTFSDSGPSLFRTPPLGWSSTIF